MIYDKTTRRFFLKGLGGSLIPLPFLSSLLPRQALAQSVGKKYYICVTCSFDIGRMSNWIPSTQPPENTYRGQESHTIHHGRLKSYLNGPNDILSPILQNSLNPYLDRMTMVNGLDSPLYAGHNLSHVLGNYLGNPRGGPLRESVMQIYANESFDQKLAKDKIFNPSGNPPLILGTNGGSTRGPLSFKRSASGHLIGQGLVGKTPREVYDKTFFFGNLGEAGQQANGSAGPGVDQALRDISSLKSRPQLSSKDKTALEEIGDLYGSIQRSITGAPTENCSHRGIDLRNNNSSLDANSSHQSYIKIISSALRCDVTRVVVYGVTLKPQYTGDFHNDVSHKAFFPNKTGRLGYQTMAEEYARFIKNVVRPLLDELDSQIDPSNGQTYLQNSVVHVCTENSTAHNHSNIPTLLIGELGGAMQTGNYLDFRNMDATPQGKDKNDANNPERNHSSDPNSSYFTDIYPGVLYNRLLVTLAQKMGLSNIDSNAQMSHILNVSDGQYGEINNGIKTAVGGFGVIVPPADSFTGRFQRGDFKNRIRNYDLRLSNVVLPLI